MKRAQRQPWSRGWMRVGPRFLPFADAATPELPLGRLLRLSLFQVSVGMAVVLLIGTLNRVMIVELGVPAWLVAVMVVAAAGVRAVPRAGRLPLRHPPLGARLAARALHLDGHAAAVRRPRDHAVRADRAVGRHQRPGRGRPDRRGARLPAGRRRPAHHADRRASRSPPTSRRRDARPRVVALLCVMLLLGMVASALAFGAAARRLQRVRLIQVIQGAALVDHGAEHRRAVEAGSRAIPRCTARDRAAARRSARPGALQPARPTRRRCLVAVGLGTAAFSMQDILLEPYGGQILHLPVGATTALTALLRRRRRSAASRSPRAGSAAAPIRYRLAALGALVGLVAFSRGDLRRAAGLAAAVRASARR